MRIILCVTNDISTDQRVLRIAGSLYRMKEDVIILGVKRKFSMPLPESGITFKRMRMLFSKGPVFYAEYNIRLFFYLLFRSFDITVANDLDTLPAVFMVSLLKKTAVVYDSHEYFTEVPELAHRPGTKRIWEFIESCIMPHIKQASTVSASIAKAYYDKYGIQMKVVRNLPERMQHIMPVFSIRIPGEKIILYQGALNMGRGLEKAISAMQFLENVRLIIAGNGYLDKELKKLVGDLNLQKKVWFIGRKTPDELRTYTLQADLGISLEENIGLSYYYALPNKLFDYIQSQIPVAVSNLPEMASIVNQYQIGRVITGQKPEQLALALHEMLYNESERQVWKQNLEIAAQELCWEKEEQKLSGIYKPVK